MATKMLSEKLGEVEYDNLIVGLTPPKRVGAGKIASTGSKEATYTRGTVFGQERKGRQADTFWAAPQLPATR